MKNPRKPAYWVSIGIVVLGLLLATWGAWRTSAAVIIDEGMADQLAGTYWGHNEALKRSLISQSHSASFGLTLIFIGSLLQILGTIAWASLGLTLSRIAGEGARAPQREGG